MENITKAYLTCLLSIIMFIRYCEGPWIYSHVFYPKVIVILSDSISTEGYYFHFDENELPNGNYKIKETKYTRKNDSLLDFKGGQLNSIEVRNIAMKKFGIVKSIIGSLVKKPKFYSKFPEIELVIAGGAIYKTKENTAVVRKTLSFFIFRLATAFSLYFRHRLVTFVSSSEIAYDNYLAFYLIHKVENILVVDISNEMTNAYLSIKNITEYFGYENVGYLPILLRIFNAYDSCREISKCNTREYRSPCVIPIVSKTISFGLRKLFITGTHISFSSRARFNACFQDVKEAVISNWHVAKNSSDLRQKLMQNNTMLKLKIIGVNYLWDVFSSMELFVPLPKSKTVCDNGLELSLREMFEIGNMVCQTPEIGFKLYLSCIEITLTSYILHYVWNIPLRAIITSCPHKNRRFFNRAFAMAAKNLYALFKVNKSSVRTCISLFKAFLKVIFELVGEVRRVFKKKYCYQCLSKRLYKYNYTCRYKQYL